MERGKFRDGDDFTKRESLEEHLSRKLARTRVARCQRKYLAAWHRLKIDWQQSASAILEAGAQ